MDEREIGKGTFEQFMDFCFGVWFCAALAGLCWFGWFAVAQLLALK